MVRKVEYFESGEITDDIVSRIEDIVSNSKKGNLLFGDREIDLYDDSVILDRYGIENFHGCYDEYVYHRIEFKTTEKFMKVYAKK